MNRLIEIREDIRLARLYDKHRWLFRLIDIFKGILKLSVLAVFCFGIWYLTYGFERFGSSVASVETTPAADLKATGSETQLSEERIAMLRDFAQRNRSLANADDSATGDELTMASALPGAEEALATPVKDRPAPIERAVSQAGDETSIEVGASDVFAELEQKLTLALDSSQSETITRTPVDMQRGPVLASAQGNPLFGNTDAGVADDPLQLDLVVASAAPLNKTEALDLSQQVEAVAPVVKTAAAEDQVGDEKWVMKQKADHYVIQISSTNNVSFLKRFEERLPQTQPTAIFEMLIAKKPEHVLIYGLFDSYDAASAELNKLSQSVRRYGAYVRPAGALQAQVRALETVAVAEKG